jgi:hypothetical protein
MYTLLLILLPCSLLLYICKTQCRGSLNPYVESFHLCLCLSWLTCTTPRIIHYIDLIHSHKELVYYKTHMKNSTCWFHICTILFSSILVGFVLKTWIQVPYEEWAPIWGKEDANRPTLNLYQVANLFYKNISLSFKLMRQLCVLRQAIIFTQQEAEHKGKDCLWNIFLILKFFVQESVMS